MNQVHHGMKSCTGRASFMLVAAGAALLPDVSRAQDEPAAAVLDEVTVTARKRGEEAAQDVPVAVTAFSGEQLEARYTRDLQSLAFTMPNVALDDVGTFKSTANFTIRGFGVNSSIPSIDPTVGVFVDGMYLGINAGVIYDLFDLESIEVLRGPQGLLFGRNVTGGAVLIRTREPSGELAANLKASVTEDLDKIVAGYLSGPIVEGKLKVKLAGYYNEDDGWFTNLATGRDFGESETALVRPSIQWTPTQNTEFVLRYEHGEFDGQGPAAQNRGLFSRRTFDFSIDEEGTNDGRWDQAILEFNADVPFGDGTITNILGWRDYELDGLSDIDSTPMLAFHGGFKVRQDQISNELRYAGRFFERMNLTAGVFWFTQDLAYFENRRVISALGLLNSTLGGLQETDTLGIFSQADINLSDSWILTLGARYTEEDKSAQIATFRPLPSRCDFTAETCAFDFVDEESWNDVTPKVGLQWIASDDVQLYTFWTKGFRSGGYNLRNTNPAFAPGPYDPEEQDSFEIGVKADWLDRRLRTNLALFYNTIDDLQREVNLPSATAGVAQVIRNTADATIQGVELDVQAIVTQNLLITGTVGYLDGEYDEVRFDILGDGPDNTADLRLDIPRLAPVTWGVGCTHELPLGTFGALTSSVNFYHRDASAYTDNNRGTLNAADMLDASIALAMLDEKLRLSVFGKNLTDEVTEGNDTQLPNIAPFGGVGASFSPLNKGRVLGLELNYRVR